MSFDLRCARCGGIRSQVVSLHVEAVSNFLRVASRGQVVTDFVSIGWRCSRFLSVAVAGI